MLETLQLNHINVCLEWQSVEDHDSESYTTFINRFSKSELRKFKYFPHPMTITLMTWMGTTLSIYNAMVSTYGKWVKKIY